VYEFLVLANSAPKPHDPDCLTYPYQSGVDLQKDVYSGLFGPMLICRPGSLTSAGKQVDSSHSHFLHLLLMYVFTETLEIKQFILIFCYYVIVI